MTDSLGHEELLRQRPRNPSQRGRQVDRRKLGQLVQDIQQCHSAIRDEDVAECDIQAARRHTSEREPRVKPSRRHKSFFPPSPSDGGNAWLGRKRAISCHAWTAKEHRRHGEVLERASVLRPWGVVCM